MNSKLYQQNLKKAMNMLAKENTIFIGQTIIFGGSPMFKSCEDIPRTKIFEMPVAEDMQMGMSLGLALEGFIPISIFPRIDFLICGINQLVNHIDKAEEMSKGEFKPGVIIRTQIGNTKPMYPGCQHCQDHTVSIRRMCKNIQVVKIEFGEQVLPLYRMALERAKKGMSTLLVEVPTGVFK